MSEHLIWAVRGCVLMASKDNEHHADYERVKAPPLHVVLNKPAADDLHDIEDGEEHHSRNVAFGEALNDERAFDFR